MQKLNTSGVLFDLAQSQSGKVKIVMEKIFEVAKYVTHPISLVALFILVSLFIYKLTLERTTVVGKKPSADILRSLPRQILNYTLFIVFFAITLYYIHSILTVNLRKEVVDKPTIEPQKEEIVQPKQQIQRRRSIFQLTVITNSERCSEKIIVYDVNGIVYPDGKRSSTTEKIYLVQEGKVLIVEDGIENAINLTSNKTITITNCF